jgi:rhodanese-related sulfurtransferase
VDACDHECNRNAADGTMVEVAVARRLEPAKALDVTVAAAMTSGCKPVRGERCFPVATRRGEPTQAPHRPSWWDRHSCLSRDHDGQECPSHQKVSLVRFDTRPVAGENPVGTPIRSNCMAKHAPRFLAIVDDAKSRVRELTVADVQARLARGDRFLLVDVREESEWAAGHLPGAVHLSKGVIERDIEQRVPDTTAEMILYCGGGFRSALAADNLQKMGYSNVWSMDGGWRGWREAGLAVVQG